MLQNTTSSVLIRCLINVQKQEWESNPDSCIRTGPISGSPTHNFNLTHCKKKKKEKFSHPLAEERKFFHCENMTTSRLCLCPQKCTVCCYLGSRHARIHTHLGMWFGFCALCGWLDGGFLPICRLAVKETESHGRERVSEPIFNCRLCVWVGKRKALHKPRQY